MNKHTQKGFIDPLSLISLGFLVVSLVVGTAVVTNRSESFDLRKSAKEIQETGAKAVKQSVNKVKEAINPKTENTKNEIKKKSETDKSDTKAKKADSEKQNEEETSQSSGESQSPQETRILRQDCISARGTWNGTSCEITDKKTGIGDTKAGVTKSTGYPGVGSETTGGAGVRSGTGPSGSTDESSGKENTPSESTSGQETRILRQDCLSAGRTWSNNECQIPKQVGKSTAVTSPSTQTVTNVDDVKLARQECLSTGGTWSLGTCKYYTSTTPTTTGINPTAGVSYQPTKTATEQTACRDRGNGTFVITHTKGATTTYTNEPCNPQNTTIPVAAAGNCPIGQEQIVRPGSGTVACVSPIEAFLNNIAPEDPSTLIAALYAPQTLINAGPTIPAITQTLANPWVQAGIRAGNLAWDTYQVNQACANPQTTQDYANCAIARQYQTFSAANLILGAPVPFLNNVAKFSSLGQALIGGSTTVSVFETAFNVQQTANTCSSQNLEFCLIQAGLTTLQGAATSQDIARALNISGINLPKINNPFQIKPIYLDPQTEKLADAGLDWSVFRGATISYPESGSTRFGTYYIDLETDSALRNDLQKVISQVQAMNPQTELETVRYTSQVVNQNFGGSNYNLAARDAIAEIAGENGLYVPFGNITSTKSTVCLENSYLCTMALNAQGVEAQTRYLDNTNPTQAGHAFVQAFANQAAVFTDPTWGGMTRVLPPSSSLGDYATQIQRIYKFASFNPFSSLIYTGTGFDTPEYLPNPASYINQR